MKKTEITQVNYPFIVGIDVSKESIDVCMIDVSTQYHYSKVLTNTKEGYLKLKRWMKQHDNDDHEHTLICMEH